MNRSQTVYIAARRRGMSPTDARTLVGAAVRLGGSQWRKFNTWADTWDTDNAPKPAPVVFHPGPVPESHNGPTWGDSWLHPSERKHAPTMEEWKN